MRRREFITLLGGAAAWPLGARAQQPAMPVVGFMSVSAAASLRQQIPAFRDGLKQAGFIDGQNVAVEYRSAEGQADRVSAIVFDLIRRPVSVLAVSVAGALVVKQEGTSIPVVFTAGEDPMKLGLVASLNRPGGNFTGVYIFTGGLEAKRLALLHEMVPKAATIAVLIDPNYPAFESQLRDVQEAAGGLGLQLVVGRANTRSDLDAAFSIFVQNGAQALLVCATPFFNSRR